MPHFLPLVDSLLHSQIAEKLPFLQNSKNLLGFSGGVDSVALFFLLLEFKIDFDIAIVHYHTRKEADDEVTYAKELAQLHNKQCFVAHAPQFTSNFEHNARHFRFKFFGEIISTYGYRSLILAHQLNDRLEWFMMQLTQGAGISNLLGFDEGCKYPIIRPLESIPKDKLYQFCNERNLRYFEDMSNADTTFRRNYFRYNFCNELISTFGEGIAKSMQYLSQDKQYLHSLLTPRILYLQSLRQKLSNSVFSQDSHTDKIHHTQQCAIFSFQKNKPYMLLLACDKVSKMYGYVLSAKQREEIQKTDFNCKIHQLLITKNDKAIFIALDLLSMYKIVTPIPMAKSFKSLCSSSAVPQKLRLLLWAEFNADTKLHYQDSNPLIHNQISQQDYANFQHKIENFFIFS